MIEIFTESLPIELRRRLTGEYGRRRQEAIRLLKNYNYVKLSINEDLKMIEFLLALSVFHRRIIANIDSANSFTSFVFENSDAESICVGNYNLNVNEKRRLYAVVTKFRSIIQNNSVSHKLLDYDDMNTFIKEVVSYKRNFRKEK